MSNLRSFSEDISPKQNTLLTTTSKLNPHANDFYLHQIEKIQSKENENETFLNLSSLTAADRFHCCNSHAKMFYPHYPQITLWWSNQLNPFVNYFAPKLMNNINDPLDESCSATNLPSQILN